MSQGQGSLIVVGSGIKLVAHVTLETQAIIEQAEKLFYVVNDPAVGLWLKKKNSTAESLDHYYAEEKIRLNTYREIAQHVLEAVRSGLQVCTVFYGHPGVFALPGHLMIAQAKREGFEASMLPGISAADCLYADLGIDPSHVGCQAYEATEFLLRRRRSDPSAYLILWQIGVVGELRQLQERDVSVGLKLVTERLLLDYPESHQLLIYEAAQYPMMSPSIEPIALADLPQAQASAVSTLVVPPAVALEFDEAVMAQLGIALEQTLL